MGNCTFSQWDYKFTMAEHPLISPEDLLHSFKVEGGVGAEVKLEYPLPGQPVNNGNVYRCYDDDADPHRGQLDYLKYALTGGSTPPSPAPAPSSAPPTVASDLPSPTAASQATPPATGSSSLDTPPLFGVGGGADTPLVKRSKKNPAYTMQRNVKDLPASFFAEHGMTIPRAFGAWDQGRVETSRKLTQGIQISRALLVALVFFITFFENLQKNFEILKITII